MSINEKIIWTASREQCSHKAHVYGAPSASSKDAQEQISLSDAFKNPMFYIPTLNTRVHEAWGDPESSS